MSPRSRTSESDATVRLLTRSWLKFFFGCFRFLATISNKPKQTVWIFHLPTITPSTSFIWSTSCAFITFFGERNAGDLFKWPGNKKLSQTAGKARRIINQLWWCYHLHDVDALSCMWIIGTRFTCRGGFIGLRCWSFQERHLGVVWGVMPWKLLKLSHQ